MADGSKPLPYSRWVNAITQSACPDPAGGVVMLSHITDLNLWDKVMEEMLDAGILASERVYLARAVLATSVWPSAKNDPRILAIRSHKLVGRGSCTNIDECYEDGDLIEDLDLVGIIDPEAAVKWAIEGAGLFLEQGLNARWGEDDDPQLLAYQEFKKKSEEG